MKEEWNFFLCYENCQSFSFLNCYTLSGTTNKMFEEFLKDKDVLEKFERCAKADADPVFSSSKDFEIVLLIFPKFLIIIMFS